MTLTLTLSSRLRSWAGLSSPSQITVSAPVDDDDLAQLGDLAGADVRRGVGDLTALDETLEHLRAGRLGEQLELGHRVVDVDLAAGRPDADEDDPLEQQLAVLDLGDVGELGRHAADAAQRLTVGAVELLAVDAVGIDRLGRARAADGLDDQLVLGSDGVVVERGGIGVEADSSCSPRLSREAKRGAPGLARRPQACPAGAPPARPGPVDGHQLDRCRVANRADGRYAGR